jgi:hypothetical protein
LLLVLQWADTSDGPEMLPESGGAHMRASGKFVNVHCPREILLQPNHRFRDLLARRTGRNELAQVRSVRARLQPDGDFLLDQRRQP